MIVKAQISDYLNIRLKNDACFFELYLAVGLNELLCPVRVRRSAAKEYLTGEDIKD